MGSANLLKLVGAHLQVGVNLLISAVSSFGYVLVNLLLENLNLVLDVLDLLFLLMKGAAVAVEISAHRGKPVLVAVNLLPKLLGGLLSLLGEVGQLFLELINSEVHLLALSRIALINLLIILAERDGGLL